MVARVVLRPLARSAVVRIAGGVRQLVEALHRVKVGDAEGEMHVLGWHGARGHGRGSNTTASSPISVLSPTQLGAGTDARRARAPDDLADVMRPRRDSPAA